MDPAESLSMTIQKKKKEERKQQSKANKQKKSPKLLFQKDIYNRHLMHRSQLPVRPENLLPLAADRASCWQHAGLLWKLRLAKVTHLAQSYFPLLGQAASNYLSMWGYKGLAPSLYLHRVIPESELPWDWLKPCCDCTASSTSAQILFATMTDPRILQ